MPGDGRAASALLSYPAAIAADPRGALYIGDTQNHLIRKVADGTITSIGRASTPTKDSGENVAEAAASRASLPSAGVARQVGEVESAKIEVDAALISLGSPSRKAAGESFATARAPGTRVGFGGGGIDVVGIEANLIVDFAFLGIAQNVVGLRDGLELFFRRLIPGIHVRMVFARKFAESFADVLGGGRFPYAKYFVVVLFRRGGHRCRFGCLFKARRGRDARVE